MNFAEELRLYERVQKAASYFQMQVYSYKNHLWETSRGPLQLKTWERGDFDETRKLAVELAKAGLVRVSLPYKGQDEGYLFEGTYYLVDQPQGRLLDLDNLMDLERAALLLAKIHKAALMKMGDDVLSVHILPDTFFVTKYGELILWGFENLRIENPYLSLAHLLYDLKNNALRDFVLKKYGEVNSLDMRALKNSEQLIWNSAVILGQQGPKKDRSTLGLERLQELVGMLWPLVGMKEYTNVPVSEYLETVEANPQSVDMGGFGGVPVSSYNEDELGVQFAANAGFEEKLNLSGANVEEKLPTVEQGDVEGSESTERPTEGKAQNKRKNEPLAWKPFPKLPRKRW